MSDEQATPEVADLGAIPSDGANAENGGVHQIPATVAQAAPDPTAAVTREKLLVAIGQEADRISGNETVQASKALAELAHAYALLTAAVPVGDGASAEATRTVPSIAPRDLGKQGYDLGRAGYDAY
ncbi:hypothetical protein ACQPW1_44705 [Nocardia sp. CA-128927]|uniref:hypothetical protein n=1 Tax=Nocardia sp. CA-128927 TaxID=3239975 RepID=UPI003D95C11E